MAEKAKGKTRGAQRFAPRKTLRQAKTTVVDLQKTIKKLRELNPEIRYKNCFEEKTFNSGIIAFQPGSDSDPKEVKHDDRDVVCHVLKGTGRLRVKNRKIRLRPGLFCHIPKSTPHDFAAGKSCELVLFYSLIKTL
jgi:mannose-6-phosphate isomerase-like protein (cupin superfamily)